MEGGCEGGGVGGAVCGRGEVVEGVWGGGTQAEQAAGHKTHRGTQSKQLCDIEGCSPTAPHTNTHAPHPPSKNIHTPPTPTCARRPHQQRA